MYKSFEEVKEALKNGIKLYYCFEADNEYGDVTLNGEKIMVKGPYEGLVNVEEDNKNIIDLHNEELKMYGPESFENPQYKKEWKTWEDIGDCDFCYQPKFFVKNKRY